MIWHIYQRAAHCLEIEDVVIATSTDPSDDGLAAYCNENGFNCHRGSLNDVMSRFLDIRLQYPQTDYFVRITGDCPLIHPDFIDNQIRALRKYKGDLIWMSYPSSILVGQGTHSWSSLEYIRDHSSNDQDKEHVGSLFISENMDKFNVVEIKVPEFYRLSGFRLTVDEQKDYDLMDRLYRALWPEKEWIHLPDAVKWLIKHGEVAALNSTVQDSAINKQVHEKIRKWQHLEKAGIWEYTDD